MPLRYRITLGFIHEEFLLRSGRTDACEYSVEGRFGARVPGHSGVCKVGRWRGVLKMGGGGKVCPSASGLG